MTDGGACLRRHGVPIMIDDPDYKRVVDTCRPTNSTC
jgi:hypothetical protein